MTLRPPPSTVLVTGGCGFIGRQLCLRLLTLGHHVCVVDNLSYGVHPDVWLKDAIGERQEKNGRIRYLLGQHHADAAVSLTLLQQDLSQFCTPAEGQQYDPALWPRSFAAVFHLASTEGCPSRQNNSLLSEAAKVAMDGQFFAWAHGHHAMIERLIYVSPKDVYGLDTTFVAAAHAGEDLARQMARHREVSVTTVRLPTVFGKDQPSGHMMAHLAHEVLRAKYELILPDSLRVPQDFLHVDDAVAALLVASLHPSVGEPITLGTATLVSPEEVARMMAQEQQRPLAVRGAPAHPQEMLLPYLNEVRGHIEAVHFRPKVPLKNAISQVLRMAERREQARLAQQQAPLS